MVFCFEIDEELDRNQKLMGTYLEKLTDKMVTKRMFENITCLDESNE